MPRARQRANNNSLPDTLRRFYGDKKTGKTRKTGQLLPRDEWAVNTPASGGTANSIARGSTYVIRR